MTWHSVLANMFAASAVVGSWLLAVPADSVPAATAQDQRIEIIIRDSQFALAQPAPVKLGLPTVIVLRNQDIIRHGFTSQMLVGLAVRGEGEGIAAYGKGLEGFYVDAGKTLVIRFITERPGSYSFRCDLHPQMKGEFYLIEVPTA